MVKPAIMLHLGAHKTAILKLPLNAACPDDFDFLSKRTCPRSMADWNAKGRDIRDERLIGKAEERYPAGDDWPSFDPFTPDQRTIFDANYRRDRDEIRAMPGVIAFRAQADMNRTMTTLTL